MNTKVKLSSETDPVAIEINTHPDTCPVCLKGIDPRFKFGYYFNSARSQLVYQCPRNECRELFIAYYLAPVSREGAIGKIHRLQHTAPQTHQPREFTEHISSVSSNFVRIYDQAHNAEELGLADIAGPGYRKALEFLIKDYAINKNPTASDAIKSRFLASVINEFVADAKIKSTATRAAWLGNDETHYFRTWDDKDLKDLKILIELTVRWIESEELTRQYEEDMTN